MHSNRLANWVSRLRSSKTEEKRYLLHELHKERLLINQLLH